MGHLCSQGIVGEAVVVIVIEKQNLKDKKSHYEQKQSQAHGKQLYATQWRCRGGDGRSGAFFLILSDFI
jgi:hypothetical protein